jgi:hypothetical protein
MRFVRFARSSSAISRLAGSIGALLLDPPPYLESAKVFDMLLAVPKIGRVKATKILRGCRVSPSKTFGGLSARQRAGLAGRLDRS